MARKTPTRKSPPKTAVVLVQKDQVFLRVGRDRFELPQGLLEKAEAKELNGKKVNLIYSEPREFLLGFQLPRRKPILCYVPVPDLQPIPCYIPLRPIRPPVTCYIVARPTDDLLAQVAERARRDLLDELVTRKIITRPQKNAVLRIKDILCYIPVPELMPRIRDELRVKVADQLLADGVLSKAVHGKITR